MDWEKIKNELEKSKYFYYATDNGVLLNGDVRDVLDSLPQNIVDLIVTSPPYNVGMDYADWDDQMNLDEYLNFVEDFLSKSKNVLKKDGRFSINIPYEVNMKFIGERINIYGEYHGIFKKLKYKFAGCADLEEVAPQKIKYTAFGSFCSPSAPYIYNPKECVLTYFKETWKKQKKGEITIPKKLFMELVSGSWKYDAETKGLTVANFSYDIPYKAMQIFTFKDNVVMDIFMGSGTTAIVAEFLKRKWIGIEISEKYCEIASKRLENKSKEFAKIRNKYSHYFEDEKKLKSKSVDSIF
jgi:site-specific DNA-methyltransferase (adenine-specific)